jgi:hypothetical protein
MKNLFLILIFINGVTVAHANADCGVTGTTAERIQNCAKSFTTSKQVIWNLVSKTTNSIRSYEVWMDSNSGLLWSDMLDNPYRGIGSTIDVDLDQCTAGAPYDSAPYTSLNCKIIKEIGCTSKAGVAAESQITDRRFELPKSVDYRQAEADGIREVVPNLRGKTFWSASLALGAPDHDVILFGSMGMFELGVPMADAFAVRCVGR